MSHAAGPGQTIVEVYKSVINDVITHVKEAFDDDGIDVDILNQLKKDWEDRVKASSAIDFEMPRPAAQGPPPLRPGTRPMMPPQNMGRPQQAFRPIDSEQTMAFVQRPMGISVANQVPGRPLTHVQAPNILNQPQRTQASTLQQQTQQTQIFMPTNALHHFQGTNSFTLPAQLQMATNTPQVYIQGNQGLPPQVMILGQNNFLSGVMQPHIVLQQPQQPQQPQQQQHLNQQNLHQTDGQLLTEEPNQNSSPGPSKTRAPASKGHRVRGAELKALLEKLKGVIQVDGTGMTDSSSEDEDAEDDAPLGLDNSGNADDAEGEENGENDEAPLNSGDDQSDDEDVDTLFASDNIVVCQFEKVGRARQKWKFTLKDGIMHISGKDYCFQKCIGEAEW